MKKVAVIIANYNGEKFLATCLASIAQTDYTSYEVVVVDDGSTDNSLAIINSWQGKLKLTVLEQNHKGASAARNYAINLYKDKVDVLIFLDNDTEVTKNWITALVAALYKEERIGGAQALLIDYENRDYIQSAGIKLIPHTCWGVAIGQGQPLKEYSFTHKKITAISAGLAVKSCVFTNTESFDELLAVSTEDIDLTWRMYTSGYKIVLAQDALVYHYTKTLAMRKDMHVDLRKQYFHISKNSIRSILKNYSINYLFYYLPLCIFINAARAVLVLLVRHDAASIIAFGQAIVWNISNFADTMNHRKAVQQNRRATDKYIYESIMIHDGLYRIYKKYFSQTKLLGK